MKGYSQSNGFEYVIKLIVPGSPYGRERLREGNCFNNFDSLIEEFDGMEKVIRAIGENKALVYGFQNLLETFPFVHDTVQELGNRTPGIVELFKMKNFLISNAELSEYIKRVFGGDIFYADELHDLSDALVLFGEKFTRNRSFSYSDLLDKEYFDILKRKSLCADNAYERSEIIKAELDKENLLGMELAKKLLTFKEKILHNMDFIGRFDLLIQKAKLAIEHNCRKPIISSDGIVLKSGGNPMIESGLKEKNRVFTKIDMVLEKGTTVLTGVNMGGKSVALNTVALNAKLFQHGFYPFAEYAEFPMLNGIIELTEDYQSTETGLSSFAGEMKKLNKAITDINTGLFLIIYDEPAKGTNPTEGSIIAKAIAEYFSDKNIILLMSTHFDGVSDEKYRLYETAGLIKNEEADDDLYAMMDYHILPKEGNKAPKDAVRICELLGINQELLALIKNRHLN